MLYCYVKNINTHLADYIYRIYMGVSLIKLTKCMPFTVVHMFKQNNVIKSL